MTTPHAPPPWIGEYALPPDSAARLVLGPMELQVHRGAQQWRLLVRREPGEPSRPAEFTLPWEGAEPVAPFESHRFGFREAPTHLGLAVGLADRPIIIRPDAPFTLLPGEEVRAYVSSPVWVRVLARDERGSRQLLEAPSFRPSDTWFGQNTRDGLLCYAGSSPLRLVPAPEDCPSHRATTPIVLRNVAEEPMVLSRIRLPVRHLSVFVGPAGTLWTERITMTHRTGDANDAIEVDHEAPRESKDGTVLSPPRLPEERAFVARAFESVFRFPDAERP